jgi:hypothetical protein
MLTLLVDHANRALSQLRGKLCLSVHSSIFSKVRASAKPGAVQRAEGAERYRMRVNPETEAADQGQT